MPGSLCQGFTRITVHYYFQWDYLITITTFSLLHKLDEYVPSWWPLMLLFPFLEKYTFFKKWTPH